MPSFSACLANVIAKLCGYAPEMRLDPWLCDAEAWLGPSGWDTFGHRSCRTMSLDVVLAYVGGPGATKVKQYLAQSLWCTQTLHATSDASGTAFPR